MIDFTVFLLVLFLTIILTVYNHRQAAALNRVALLVQDFVAMQIRDRRRAHQQSLAEHIDPLTWLSHQVSAGLEKPLVISDVMRVVHEINAVELRADGGRRVIVSTASLPEIRRYDKRLLASRNGKSAAGRMEAFAARPLLGRAKAVEVERVMDQQNEFFDLEAGAVGERLGVAWGNPLRLWFYVVAK